MIVGGAQENTLDSARGLAAGGWEVTLITGCETGDEGNLLVLSPEPSLRVIFVPSLLRNLNPLRDVMAFFALWKIFRRERFDVVHTHSSKAGILGRFAARCAGVPHVVHTVHGFAIGAYQSTWRNVAFGIVERLAARCADDLICVAESLMQEAAKLRLRPRGKIVFVPSGFDWDLFASARRNREKVRAAMGITEQELLVTKVARFFPMKGHSQLFERMGTLLQKYPLLKFLLVGDGILRGHFESIASERGWSKRVFFTGLVAPSRVADLLGASDILVHTSLREGLARVIPQAFACSLPVVCFDADGARDLVRNGVTGFLLSPSDAMGFSSAMSLLIEDSALRRRLGEAGHDLAAARYPLSKMVAALEKIYGDKLSCRS